MERIIKTSSNEGDIVLDPFCGCGTAVVVSQELNREMDWYRCYPSCNRFDEVATEESHAARKVYGGR